MDRQDKMKRRGLLGGAATVGALATAAAVLPLAQREDSAPATTPAPDARAGKAGYQLTAHVQHYYKTARI
jgi:hypothetical protein